MAINGIGRPRINIIGQTFGGLTVLEWVGGKNSAYACRCVCGNIVTAYGGNLRAGRGKTCGCGARVCNPKITHGASGSKEYATYRRMLQRCDNPKNPSYEWYGALGIKVLFENYESFFRAIGPAPSPAHEVDRIDSDKHYETGNVRWATRKEQIANRKDRGKLGNNQFKTRPQATGQKTKSRNLIPNWPRGRSTSAFTGKRYWRNDAGIQYRVWFLPWERQETESALTPFMDWRQELVVWPDFRRVVEESLESAYRSGQQKMVDEFRAKYRTLTAEDKMWLNRRTGDPLRDAMKEVLGQQSLSPVVLQKIKTSAENELPLWYRFREANR